MKPNIFWLDLRPVPLKGISCLIMYSDSKAHSWTCHGPFDENLLLLFNQWSWCLSHGLLNNIVYTYRPGCFQFGQGSLCIWQWSIKSYISDNSSQKKKRNSVLSLKQDNSVVLYGHGSRNTQKGGRASIRVEGWIQVLRCCLLNMTWIY